MRPSVEIKIECLVSHVEFRDRCLTFRTELSAYPYPSHRVVVGRRNEKTRFNVAVFVVLLSSHRPLP